MDKAAIFEAILEKLVEAYENFRDVSKRTRQSGNDAETKAEDKYDTRSTEENYLADGLARQAATAAEAAEAFRKLAPLREFGPDTPLDLGALMQVDFGDEVVWFFLGPAAGGLEISHEGEPITVLTPDSPLGSQLKGAKPGTKAGAVKVVKAL